MSVVRTDQEARTVADQRRAKRLQELSDLREVMTGEAGRRVMWRLLSECRVFLSTYAQDALESYYRQGRRAVGLVFYNDILEACPEAFWQAQRENISKENENG